MYKKADVLIVKNMVEARSSIFGHEILVASVFSKCF